MNKIYTIFIAIFLLTLFNVNGFSQCTWGGWSAYPAATQSTTSSAWTTVSTLCWGGDYGTYSVTSGSTYEWSLCSTDGGSCSYSGNLTMFNGSTNALITSASANCGNDSKITWTATFTGTVYVLITQAACTANTTSTTIVWRCSTCSGPVNNLCGSPTALTVGTSCTTTTGNVSGATESLVGCAGTANDDVWYSFVATSSTQNISVVGAASFDAVVQVYSGTCAALSSIICVDNTVDGGTESTTITGMTVGNTYLVRVYDYGSDVPATPTFTICVYGGTGGGSPTTGDCLGAYKVCQNTYSFTNTVTGIGNIDDLGVTTPCGTYEKNATWYVFTVNSSGIFRFTLNSSVDYDWALYNITGASCADILSGALASVRCNYSATTGNTGMSAAGINANENASGSVWCSELNVTAGETFALLVDNYNGGAVGYDLDFSTGSAGIFDGNAPYLYQITSAPACGQGTITVDFNEVIDITSVDATDFTLTSGSTTYTITSAVGVNGTADDQSFLLTLNTALTSGGTYTLSLTGQVADACNNAVSTSSLAFTVTGVAANVTSTNPSCFNGSDGTATSSASGGTAPYTYLWSTGATTSSISSLSVGTYTVTVRDNNGAGPCQDVQSVTISNTTIIFEDDFDPTPSTTWLTGAISGTSSWATGQPQGGEGDYALSNPDPTQDHSSNASNNVYGQRLGTTTSGGYNNSSNEWLRTQAINCTGKTGITLSFWRWANFEPNYDEAYVEVSNNGATWNDLGHPLYPQDNVWTYVTYNISAYADNQATVYIRWRSNNDISTTYSGWNIDDVVVTANLVAISGTTSVTNVACFGNSTGAIDLTPTGGSGTYSGYLWTGGATTQDISSKPAGTYTVTITDNRGCTGTVTSTITQPASVLSNSLASQTNVLCFNNSTGAIDITPAGGTPAYTYSWTGPSGYTSASQDLTSRPAGVYAVTITDANSCTTTGSYTITQPASGLSVALTSQTNVGCFGASTGAINITASGGTSPYSYNWGGGITTEDRTGLSAGTYSVTVSDNSGGGCTATLGVTITQPASALAVVVTSQTNVLCFGNSTGAINISASGGTTAYSYNWGGGITSEDRTGLSVGTYSVTVTDANSCTASVGATITQPASVLSNSLASQTNVLCFSNSTGAIDITPAGGTPAYTYSWTGPSGYTATSQDLTSRPAGVYAVTITDANSCTTTGSYTITQPASGLSVALTSQTNVGCFGASTGAINITASGGTSPYSYNWGGGITTEDRTGLSAGTYSVTVSDNSGGGCTATLGVTITQPTSALAVVVTSQTNVLCFGNSTGAINITASGGTTTYSYNWGGGITTEDRTGLSIGTYSVTVTDANLCTASVSATITQPASALSASIVGTNVSCNGGTNGAADLTPNGGTAGYTYNWGGGITTQDRTGLSAGTYTATVTDANSCTTTASVTITQPVVLSASMTKVDVTCNGGTNGTATATPSGGTGPFTYHWDDATFQSTQTANGLVSGIYNVTVTDANSCTAFGNITVNQPLAIVVTTSSTQSVCLGSSGSATATISSGGVSPYDYAWSSGQSTINSVLTTNLISSIPADSYTVTVTDANNCTGTSNVNVTDAAGPSSNISIQTDVSCNGGTNGSATVSITSGGTSPFDYVWSSGGLTSNSASTTNTENNLAAGVYSVVITDDNGCTTSSSVTITQPAALNAAITAQTNVLCNNASTGSATVTISGGTANYNYNWPGAIPDANNTPALSNTANNIPDGSYTVTITDANSCVITATANITEPADLTASIAGTNVSCFGGSNGGADLTPAGGTLPYTYLWSNTSTNQDLINIADGIYGVTVTDANSCTETASVTITEPGTALNVTMASNNVSCFGGSNGNATANLVGGTSPYTYIWSNSANTQTISGLSAAIFAVTVTDNNGCIGNGSVTITQPVAALQATISSTNINCFGQSTGAVNLTVSGGTTAYSYSWTGPSAYTAITEDLTLRPAGAYNVTVTDANSCTTTASVTLTEPAASLSASIVGTNVSCNGASTGAADLTVIGGTAPYTYSWTNSSTNQDLLNVAQGVYTVTVTDFNTCTATASVTISQPASALTVNMSSTNVTCFGLSTGTATATPSGGTSAYSFLWSNSSSTASINGLSAAIYAVTVTDANSCTATGSVTITQPVAALQATINPTNINCFGQSTGAIDLTVSGGTTAYSYSWTGPSAYTATTEDLTLRPAGAYNVTVTDANSCTTTASVTLSEPASALNVSIIGTDVSCFGGTTGAADLTVSGGTAPYTYLWSNASVNQDLLTLAAGNYSVTVTDNKACQAISAVTISQPAVTLSTSISPTNISCNGSNDGEADLTVTGGTTAYTYLWGGGQVTEDLTGLSSGNYSVTVTDNKGCTSSSSVTITQPSALSVTASRTNITCNGDDDGTATATPTGGTSPYSYSWNSTPVQNTQIATGLALGTYTVIVTDDNSCTANASVTIIEPFVLTATIIGSDVSCNGLNDAGADLTVTGGNAPYSYNWSTLFTGQDLSNVAAGNYSVTVTDNKGCTANASVTLTEPTTLSTAVTSTNVLCRNGLTGAIDVTVSGGTVSIDYGYLWNNGATTVDLNGIGAGSYSGTITDDNGCTAVVDVTITQPAAVLTATALATNIICNGVNTGSINLTVSGGTTAYSYSWSGPSGYTNLIDQDINSLFAGAYSVVVTDANGCTVNASATVNEPSALSASIVPTDVLCNGEATGDADLTISGGTTPYAFNWSNSSSLEDLTDVVAGIYGVTITDFAGCLINASTTISEPSLIVLTTSTTNSTCGSSNGTATVNISGGLTPYTVNWNGTPTGDGTTTISNLSSSAYLVSVTDVNGCIKTATANVIDAGAPTISIDSQTNVDCNGDADGAVTVLVSGGVTPYTYSWSIAGNTDTQTGLSGGVYDVTVEDSNNCSANLSVTITEPAALVASIASQTNINCFGGTNGIADLNVTGGTTPYSYLWSNAAVSQDLTNIPAGIYTVDITDANTCTANSSVTITEPNQLIASITSSTNASAAGVCDGTATVGVAGGTTSYTYSWSNSQITSSLVGLCAGIYTVTATDSKGCTSATSVTITEPGSFSLSYTQVNVLCNGNLTGEIDLTVTGGTTPYNYDWSNVAGTSNTEDQTGLIAGTYIVTVTDANSYSTQTTVIITQPSILTTNIVKTNVACFGDATGAVDLTVAGGVGPYAYNWTDLGSFSASSQDISGLTPATYYLTVTDANGCIKTATTVITEPLSALTSTVSVTNVNCFNNATGMVDITPNGGVVPYTYNWSNGASNQDISNVLAGNYDVTITDANGCTFSLSATITEPATGLTVDNITSTDALCYNGATGSADLTFSGGTSPFTFNWSYGYNTEDLTNVVAGVYDVTVTDVNSCYTNGSVTIGQPIAPITITTSQTNSTCNNSDGTATITVTGGTVSVDYIYDWAGTPTGDGTNSISALGAGTYLVTVTDDNACAKVEAVYISDIGGVVLDVIKLSDVDCNGNANGSAMANTSGGTTPYIYNWSSSINNTDTETGLSGGTVTLTLTDATGCISIDSVIISEPNLISLSAIISDVTCFGTNTGSIDLTVSGGKIPYTYLWSNTNSTQDIFNLSAGTYDVTVTDGAGCTASSTYNVTEPISALSVNGVGTNVSCYGMSDGAVDLTASGGTTPYNYYWNYGQSTDSISNLFATTYSVTVIDNNLCEVTENFTITQPSAMNVSVVGNDALCFGDSNGTALATVFGATSPYLYSWSSGLTPTLSSNSGLTNGSHTVTVTDANGCIVVKTVTINQPDSLIINATVKDVKCSGQSTGVVQLTVTGGKVINNYQFNWDNGDNTSSISYISAGQYCVAVTDDNACIANLCVTISEPALALSIGSTVQNVSCNNGNDASIDLIPVGGTPVYTFLWNYGQITEDISGLTDGIYTVTITDFNGCKLTSSFNITQPVSAVNSVVVRTNSSCGLADGSATVTAVGGTSPYTFLWSNGAVTDSINNLAGGVYTVVITDSLGCTKVDSATIIQPSVLSAIMNTTDVLCYGASTGAVDLTVSGGTGTFTYAWSVSGASTAAISNKPAGSYCVTITDDNGCTFDSCATIAQPTDSILVIDTLTNINCYGSSDGSIVLTVSGGAGSPYQFLWNDGQILDSLTGLSVGYHTVTITDANGCTESETYNITQPIAGLVSTMTKVNSTCENDNGTAMVTAVGGTSPYTYLWEDFSVNDSIIDLSPDVYYVTVTDANGCSKVDSTTIIDLGNPMALTLNKVNVSCNGGSDGFWTVFAANGASPIAYLWDNSLVNNNQTYTGLSAGIHNVIITDANGCQDSTSTVINEPDLLVAVPVISDALCYGDTTGQIYADVSGGTASYTYLWSTTETSAIISNLVSGTYSVTITDSKGCTADTSITINQPTAPLSSIITSNNTTCYGAKDADIFVETNGGTPNYKYIWNYGQNNDTIFNILPGTYIVTITDANQCTHIDSILVTQPDAISISWTSVESHCGFEDGSATLDTITGGTSPFSWLWSNGDTGITADSLAFGAHTIQVTDINACVRTFDFNINFVGSIPVTAGATQIRCYGLTGSVVANVGAGYAPFDYTFYQSDSTIIGMTTSYADSASFSNVISGSYFVLVTDSVGCKGSAPVTIAPQPSDIVAYIIGTDVTCKGNGDGFAVVHADGGRQLSGSMPYNYYWTNGLSTDSTITNLQPFTSYSVTITDANNCYEIQEVLVNEPAKIVSVGTDTIVPVSCYKGKDGMLQVDGMGGNGTYSYVWSNGQSTNTAFGLVAGNYTVTVTDYKSCSANLTLQITQPTDIIITNVSTNTSCRDSHDGEIVLTVSGGVGNFLYLWNTTDFSTDYMVENLYGGDYVVTVTDDNSCTKIDTITVNSEDVECLEIPSCFTPNTDGINDKWEIKNIDLYPDVKVEIYNRWGNILFKEEKGYFGKEWDGTFNGQLIPAASYVYILTFPDGKVEPKTGVVTIIR